MSMVLMAVLAATLIGPLDQTTVTPEWLERNLTSQDVVLVEVGWASTADKPHIPGSRFLPIESIVTRNGWPPDELPSVEELRSALGKAGIGDDGRSFSIARSPFTRPAPGSRSITSGRATAPPFSTAASSAGSPRNGPSPRTASREPRRSSRHTPTRRA